MTEDWIEYIQDDSDTHPYVGQHVIYFFNIVGKHIGQYDGDWCFSSEKGFLSGDVTHWMPYEGQDLQSLTDPLPRR